MYVCYLYVYITIKTTWYSRKRKSYTLLKKVPKQIMRKYSNTRKISRLHFFVQIADSSRAVSGTSDRPAHEGKSHVFQRCRKFRALAYTQTNMIALCARYMSNVFLLETSSETGSEELKSNAVQRRCRCETEISASYYFFFAKQNKKLQNISQNKKLQNI